MTLGQLRAFLAVVDTGSVRAAADRLVVSQPAVSMAVAALGRSVGSPLTIRDGRGLRLTPAGETFSVYARDAVALLDAGTGAAAGSADPERGRLRVAAVTTAAEHVLPEHLARFRARFPHAQIHLEVGNRDRVWDLLAHHEVDVAVGGRPPVALSLEVEARRDNALVLIGSPSRPVPATVDELAAETWLLREPGSGTRRAVEELLADLDLEPPCLTLGSNGAIRESVAAGLGISVLSHDAVAQQLARTALVSWSVGPFPVTRPWHAVVRADRSLPPTASLFVAQLVASGFERTDLRSS